VDFHQDGGNLPHSRGGFPTNQPPLSGSGDKPADQQQHKQHVLPDRAAQGPHSLYNAAGERARVEQNRLPSGCSPLWAAARGTPHQAAAAVRGGDFTFTRKTLPPAAVPSGVVSGRGAAISTTSTLHRQSPPQPGRPQSVAMPTSIGEIIATFQDILNPKGDLQRTSDDVAHHIQTRGPPMASKFRRLDSEKLAAAKKEFLALERAGIVR